MDERDWARPEEAFGALQDFLVALRTAKRLNEAAATRAARLKWREAAAAKCLHLRPTLAPK